MPEDDEDLGSIPSNKTDVVKYTISYLALKKQKIKC